MVDDANRSELVPSRAAAAYDITGIASLAQTKDEVAMAAAARGFVVPPACMPGVITNLAVLRGHGDILLGGSAGDRS